METTTTKICTKCITEKSITEFHIKKNTKDGYNNHCKQCRIEYNTKNKKSISDNKKRYHQENKEKRLKYAKEYRLNNADKIKEYKKDYQKQNKLNIAKNKRNYYEANKEKFVKYAKENYLKNKDIISDKNKDRYIANKDKINKYKKEYYKTLNYKIFKRKYSHKRNTKIRITNDKTINRQSLKELLIKQDNKCYYCKCELDFNVKFSVHLDHYIPIAKGGLHSINNVVWSCKNCNLSKQGKMPNEPLVL